MSDIKSLIDAEKDIIAHPDDDLKYLDRLFESDLFTESDIKNINDAFKILIGDEKLSESQKYDMLNNSWKINFRRKITPEEFLTERYIGSMANDIYPHIKETFIKFFDPIKNYRELDLYCAIGFGKTTLLALIKLYVAVQLYFMRNPKQMFKLGISTVFTDCSVASTKEQAYTFIIKPLQNIMNTSPAFERLKFEYEMESKIKENPDIIYFSNTSKGSSVMRIGDVFYNVISDANQMLGLNIVNFSCSEIAFLTESMPEDRVKAIIDEGKGRIWSRFGNAYLMKALIDSSPNSLENIIDQYIYNEASKDPSCLFINQKKWECQPYLFDQWYKDNSKTFPIFVGTVTKPPKIIENDLERKNYDEDLVYDVPIDILHLAKGNLSKTIRDYLAIPNHSSDQKLINDHSLIERCFVPNLSNVYTYCYASYIQAPEQLLWNEIKKICFVYTGRGNLYKLKRNPNAERYIGIDLAEKKDMASVSMIHLECNTKGEKVYVVDFTLPIMSKKDDKINIDAFKFLVSDLRQFGQVNLKHISYDQFQSSSSRQYLERLGFEVERISVDISPENYLSMISYIQQNRLKMGKNIIIKNNLKSLILTNKGHHGKGSSGKLVVDHVQGEWIDMENIDWIKSKMGYFGKDGTDSLCQAITLADMYGTLTTDYLYNYDEELIVSEKEFSLDDNIGKKIEDKFGLTLI